VTRINKSVIISSFPITAYLSIHSLYLLGFPILKIKTVFILLLLFISVLLFLFNKTRVAFKALVFFLSICLLFTLFIKESLDLPIASEKITALKGTLVSDSTFSDNSNSVLILKLSEVEDRFRNKYLAKGRVTLISKEHRQLLKGEIVKGEGSFVLSADEKFIFIGESLHVLKNNNATKTSFIFLRRRILNFLVQRFDYFEKNERESCKALLLGIKENYYLSEAALYSGSTHILALSGMHLGALALFVSLIIGIIVKRRLKSLISLVFLFLYLITIGFKSSLVRAFILFCLYIFQKDQILLKQLGRTYFIQMVLFPSTISSLASLLSYLSLFALALFSLQINTLLEPILPRFVAYPLAASISVNLLLAPFSLAFFHSWFPIGIIVALLVVPLATFLVSVALVGLIIQNRTLSFIIKILVMGFEKVLTFGERFSLKYSTLSSWKAYVIISVTLLTLFGFLRYGYHKINQRCRKNYDMGLQLRFGEGNKRTLGNS